MNLEQQIADLTRAANAQTEQVNQALDAVNQSKTALDQAKQQLELATNLTTVDGIAAIKTEDN